jgi:hypothetical protein
MDNRWLYGNIAALGGNFAGCCPAYTTVMQRGRRSPTTTAFLSFFACRSAKSFPYVIPLCQLGFVFYGEVETGFGAGQSAYDGGGGGFDGDGAGVGGGEL